MVVGRPGTGMMPERRTRLAAWLSQEVVRRPMPHGLVSWRYLLRRPPCPVAAQRSLWLHSVPALPRPVWLLMEAWLWAKWELWHGPIRVWRALRKMGPRVQEEEGIGLVVQAWRVATLSLGLCLPPSEIYHYRLYRDPDRAFEFVFDHTVAAFHQGRNARNGKAAASLRLLGDKVRQAEELSAAGVPTVPTLAVAERGSGTSLEALFSPAGSSFCKPRHGSRGRGAAGITSAAGSVTVETLDGHRLTGAGAAAWWAEQLGHDDMLVQPWLRTHPDLADLATEDDVVTVRYISERQLEERGDGDVGCYCATLELPAGRSGEGDRPPRYVILEVDPVSGRILGFPVHLLPREAADRYRTVVARLGRRAVPGWQALRRASHVAHGHLPGVHAIAWDWALTTAGPLLLEGNGGWGPADPQLLKGGLLAGRTTPGWSTPLVRAPRSIGSCSPG